MVNLSDRSRRQRCQEDIAVLDDLARLSSLPRFVGSAGTARVAGVSNAGRVFASGQTGFRELNGINGSGSAIAPPFAMPGSPNQPRCLPRQGLHPSR